MTKKEWEKIIELESRKAFRSANEARVKDERLTCQFMLGYHAGLKYALAAMKGEIIIPEIDYNIMEADHDREEED